MFKIFTLELYTRPRHGGSVSKLNVDGVLDLQAHLQDEYRILNIV